MNRMSIIIPTRNRARSLGAAIASIAAQDFDPRRFEILVVDNDSTDETGQVAQTAATRSDCRVRCVAAPTAGLHHARHGGAGAAEGDVLVFVDDDILATPGWLRAIDAAFDAKDIGLVGGPVAPRYDAPVPEWVAPTWERSPLGRWNIYLSLIDLGDRIREIAPNYVFGCNYAIRAEVLDRCGGFHPDAVPQEAVRFRGDGEYGLGRKLARLGFKARYHPEAAVTHVIPASRLTVAYFFRRAFNEGVSQSYTRIRETGRPALAGAIDEKTAAYAETMARHLAADTFRPSLEADDDIRMVLHNARRLGEVYHQKQVAEDPELLAHVLREDYRQARQTDKTSPGPNDGVPGGIPDPSEPAETVMLRQAGEAMADGLRLLKRERCAEALRALERAMYLWPAINGLHRSRALCLQRLGRTKEAEMAARAAIGQDPEDRQAAALLDVLAEGAAGPPAAVKSRAAPADGRHSTKPPPTVTGDTAAATDWIDTTTIKPREAVLYITDTCNSRCVTCNAWQRRDERPLSSDAWCGILGDLRAIGVSSVEFMGGEPLLRQDLHRLVAEAGTLGFARITVSSNGFLMSDETVDRLVGAGANVFHVSLDGGRETYKALRGVDRFERVVDAMCRVVNAGVELVVLTTLVRQNIDELPAVAGLADRLGAHWFPNLLENKKHLFKGVVIDDLLITTPEDIARTIHHLEAIGRAYPRTSLLQAHDIRYIRDYLEDPGREGHIPCVLGFKEIYIGSAGEVYPACMSLGAAGNAMEQPLAQIIDAPPMRRRLRAMYRRQCRGCTCGYAQRAAMMDRFKAQDAKVAS